MNANEIEKIIAEMKAKQAPVAVAATVTMVPVMTAKAQGISLSELTAKGYTIAQLERMGYLVLRSKD